MMPSPGQPHRVRFQSRGLSSNPYDDAAKLGESNPTGAILAFALALGFIAFAGAKGWLGD